MSAELLIRNDMDIWVRGFRDSRIRPRSASYLNAATTATWELRDGKVAAGGAILASGTLTYDTGSNGDYVAGIDDSVTIVEGTDYYVHVVLVEGGVRFDHEELYTGARRTGRTPTG